MRREQTDDDFRHGTIVRIVLRLRFSKSLSCLSKARDFCNVEKSETSCIACNTAASALISAQCWMTGSTYPVRLRLYDAGLSIVEKLHNPAITNRIDDRFLPGRGG
jgi:hypothetical protein